MPIQIIKKGITKLNVDAIVNAANSALQAGGGVCGAVFEEAGYVELQKECDSIGHCETGNAVVTKGYNLPAKYIIHAVGPIYSGSERDAKLLKYCYYNCLNRAKELNLKSIAFPAISTGIFGYPLEEATVIAVNAVKKWIYKNKYDIDVYFSVRSDKTEAVYNRVLNGDSEENEDYNKKVDNFGENYRALNRFVMSHTKEFYENNSDLNNEIVKAKKSEYIVYEEDSINVNEDGPSTNIIVSKNRTFEAAQKYKGKKVAVLNFANNHSIGGAPWSAGAQEESMCRCSTLYACLETMANKYYDKHLLEFKSGKIDHYGNDDMIYIPNVVVFKSDESAPKLLDKNEWYNVDVITSAAPECKYGVDPIKLEKILDQRIKKIIQIAKKEKVEVLILGAYGCGAFKNPPELVAKLFKKYIEKYYFETVEFAVYCSNNTPGNNYDIFCNILNNR